jgi:hypothetical protein
MRSGLLVSNYDWGDAPVLIDRIENRKVVDARDAENVFYAQLNERMVCGFTACD